jgi:hypothetical protein
MDLYPDPIGSSLFLCGAGSGRLGPGPDPDSGKFKWKSYQKIYLDQDPDQDVLKGRIRIWKKIVRIRNTAFKA